MCDWHGRPQVSHFFFFQAEDGIRDGHVTGVQTCALPIYVIIGHNERRRLQGETDQRIAKKFIAARESELIPVLCVGESQQERDSGNALETIVRQLNAVIDVAGLEIFRRAVVAYEPVWAVGTGKTATPEQA